MNQLIYIIGLILYIVLQILFNRIHRKKMDEVLKARNDEYEAMANLNFEKNKMEIDRLKKILEYFSRPY